MLQHFKDVLNMRKNEGEILRKLRQQNHNSSAQAGADVRGPETQGSSDVTLLMSREQCVPVIRGLVALMLSMDFTCNVDFFVVIGLHGEAEVGQLHPAIGGEHDVLGFDIPVDNTFVVGVLQSIADLSDDTQRLI